MGKLYTAVVALLGLCFATAAQAEWREATSEHFIIQSGGPEQQLIRLSQQLEALHWLLGRATGVTPVEGGPRVRIYLVDRLSDVHRAMGVNGSSDAAGFYRPTQEGAIAVVPRDQSEFSSIILFHEYAHHFMLQHMRGVYPPWYIEGFAEVLSTAQFDRPGQITYGAVAYHRANELSYLPWVPIQRMMQPRDPEDRNSGVASYGQYWLIAHYFIFTDERRGQLRAFVQALRSSQNVEEAANAAFPGGLEQLDRDLRRYLRSNRFQYQRVPLPPQLGRPPVVRVMRAGEAAVVAEELQAMRPMSAEDHVPIAERVRRTAARYPDDPAVALLEARLWRYAGRFPEAAAATDRALALDSANVVGLTLKGQILLEAAAAGGGVPSEDIVRTARASIVRANRADPENQIPLIAYYESFGLAGQPATEAAVDGLYKASTLVPQDPALRMTVVRELIDRGNLSAARNALAPLAFAPHRSQLQSYALLLLRWIDAGGTGERPPPPEEDQAVESEGEQGIAACVACASRSSSAAFLSDP